MVELVGVPTYRNRVVIFKRNFSTICEDMFTLSMFRVIYLYSTLRGDAQKKNSIFADIVQIGGGEVNPMSKN